MLTLHHLEKSRSFRIVWALEELGIEYQLKHYRRQPSFAAPEELKQYHPLGKAPILTGDDGLVVVESAVILDYLIDHYDRARVFRPDDPALQREYAYWMHYAEGSLMPLLVMTLVLSMVPKKVPLLIRPVAHKIVDGVGEAFTHPRLKEHLHYLENYLTHHTYFAGDFSFADIQMSFPLFAITERFKGQYPHIHAFVERVQQRPAYHQARQRGGE